MPKNKSTLFFGLALVSIGVLNLLHNLRYFYFDEQLTVGFVILAIASLVFYRFVRTKRSGLLILSAILGFIGTAIFLESLGFHNSYVGVIFLWGISALFAYGFFSNTDRWGFIIPSGVFLTLGLIVYLESNPFGGHEFTGGIFFLGLGLTFGFLYLIRNDRNNLQWARIPALILVGFSLFITLVSSDPDIPSVLFPTLLIGGGSYLLWKSTYKNRKLLNGPEQG